ncbi:MAG: DNA polymerase III subunit delta [Puniceicoccales bacterium]|jgi:DNA polymerase-3 subunit delta|nr:DNA polymerase III subunit delta [Puniceicoccales bacterium]
MPARFHFFTGDDDYLVDRAARACFEKFNKETNDPLSSEIISATATKEDDALAILANFIPAVTTLPLFGGKKNVWLRTLNWLARDTLFGRSEAGKDCLARLQKTLDKIDPENFNVVISAFPADGTRSETKWLKNNSDPSASVPLLKGKGGDKGVPAAILAAEANALGVKLSDTVCEELLEKVGANLRMAIEEVRKLASYIGASGGAITSDMIAKLVPVFGEGDFFEPVEAFYSANIEYALDSLRRFFFHNPKAGRGLLATLQKRNRLLLQLRTLTDARAISGSFSEAALSRAAAEYGSAFGDTIGEKNELNVFAQNGFYLSRLARSAKIFSLRSLIELQLAFVDCYNSILARPNEEEAVFREFFERCLTKK